MAENPVRNRHEIDTELTFHGGKHNSLIVIHRTIKKAPEAVQKPMKVCSKAGKACKSAVDLLLFLVTV